MRRIVVGWGALTFMTIFSAVVACSSEEDPVQDLPDGAPGEPDDAAAAKADARAEADGASPIDDASIDDALTTLDATPDAADASDTADASMDASLDAESDASFDAADASTDASCTTLVQSGSLVSAVPVIDHVTGASGGTIVDGTYVLTSAIHYVDHQSVPIPMGRETLRFTQGVLEDVWNGTNGTIAQEARFTATLDADRRLTPTCTQATESDSLRDWGLFLPPPHAGYGTIFATPTSLTVWNTRGNHESIEKVFTKIEDAPDP